MKISKLHGCGNDFIITTDQKWLEVKDKKDFVKKICQRKFGVGADGFLFLKKSNAEDYMWDFYNSDGSYAEMCGNAARCVGEYLFSMFNLTEIILETKAGKIFIKKIENNYSVKMLVSVSATLVEENIYFINTGVPHLVAVDTPDENKVISKYRQYNNKIDKTGCNITFINTKKSPYLVKSFERGVEAFTSACGTGAVAAALVLKDLKKQSTIEVKMPGGKFKIEVNEKGVYLIGPAVYVYKGEYCL